MNQYEKPSMFDHWVYCPYCSKKINHERIIPINGCSKQCIEK